MNPDKTDHKAQAAQNRQKFPFAAQIVDELRAEFGAGVTLVYAEENGQTIGKKLPVGMVPIIYQTVDKFMLRRAR